MKKQYAAPQIEQLYVRPIALLKEPSIQTEEDISFEPIGDNGEWR